MEQCDLIAISKELSIELFQPEAKKEVVEDDQKDDLNWKIRFLQSISLFRDVEAQYLMPIACNLKSRTFSFGDYIIREGELPQGLFIIKSGQCKVASSRITERDFDFDLNRKLGDRKRVDDRGQHPLLQDFDPENTLLNVWRAFLTCIGGQDLE